MTAADKHHAKSARRMAAQRRAQPPRGAESDRRESGWRERGGSQIRNAQDAIDARLARAWQQFIAQIQAGAAPREALAAVMRSFPRAQAQIMAQAMSDLLGRAVGTEAVGRLRVGVAGVTLSGALWADVEATGKVVANIIQRHARGWADARALALEMFEGYGYRPREALRLAPQNHALPKYLRTELLTDTGLRGELERFFARGRASTRKTAPLRQSYLDALDAIEAGRGQAVLARKLEIAGLEKLRYNAQRIARTELARAHECARALELQARDDVQFVQVRMSRAHPAPDICDYHASIDRYGLGKGVYPKHLAPVPPYHPHCLCVLAPRIDFDEDQKWRERPDAGRDWLARQDPHHAARIAGSRDKRDAILQGRADLLDLYNRAQPERYRTRNVGDITPDDLAHLVPDNAAQTLRDLTIPESATKGEAQAALKAFAQAAEKQPMINMQTGWEGKVNRDQRDKMLNGKAVGKSRANGFTAAEHYAMAACMEQLWKHSEPIGDFPDYKNKDGNVRIKRLAVAARQGGEVRYASILAKETISDKDGHRIYTLELHTKKTLRSIWETLPAQEEQGTQPASLRSVDEIIAAIEAKIKR